MRTTTTCRAARWLQGLLAAMLIGGGLTNAALADDGDWKSIRPSSPVFGLDGRGHSASCSAYPGTDPSYRFWARKGKSRNLVVYFEGGGACWNDLTCTFPGDGSGSGTGFYTPALPPGASPAQLNGIFNLQRDDNPVKDWDMVYVPYCTGDLHSGSAVQRYFNAGAPGLPVQFNIRHKGFDNTMVVLDWVRRNFEAPRKVLVAGSSAGGYGATINFPWLRKLYPRAHVSVLADASQGITTPDFDTGGPRVGRGSWNTQLPPWATAIGLDPADIPGPQLMHAAAQAHPEVRVAQFTTVLDEVQIGFYGVMRGCFSLEGPGCGAVPQDWYLQMATGVLTDRAMLPNYRHYVAAGSYHTILTGPEFFSERSTGLRFRAWLDAMLGGADGVPGPRWRNEACLGCLP
jgi:Pectinacetylesterase